jgi:SpoVK/Ycf46/Vps4 family AAA+-type ATPase
MSPDRSGAFTTHIKPAHGWRDVPASSNAIETLRRIPAARTEGRGVPVLFSGRSGPGKLVAAEVIAADLAVDVLRVDLRAVVGKYIGETEKNLDLVFADAAASGAVLFFDEADALFGKRSNVKDAHDRYANLDIGNLLQRIEAYPGIAVLATNQRQNIDQVFIRRLKFVVDFDLE